MADEARETTNEEEALSDDTTPAAVLAEIERGINILNGNRAVSDPTLFTVPAQGTDSDERFTPRWLFDALGETFDLDVAAPLEGGDCVPAAARYTRLDDGLARPWHGFVWCNPPFSAATAWADRFIAHGAGLWLGPVANARWFIDLAGAASLLWLMRDFAFNHPSHAGRRSSMPLAMAALEKRGARALHRASRLIPTAGVLVEKSRLRGE